MPGGEAARTARRWGRRDGQGRSVSVVRGRPGRESGSPAPRKAPVRPTPPPSPSRARLAAAALLLAAALPAAAAPAPAAAHAPGVAALVQQVVAAYGGQAALDRMARAYAQGNVTSQVLHPGAPGLFARAYERPGGLRVEIQYPDREGEVRVLARGRGWRFGEEVRGPSLAAMVLQAARLDLPALLAAAGPKVAAGGTWTHEGKALRVLSLEVAPGLLVEAGVDPATGRILRSRGTARGGPPVEFVTTYSDFRTVEGVLVPFREGNWANGQTTGETVLSQVAFPASFPPLTFEP